MVSSPVGDGPWTQPKRRGFPRAGAGRGGAGGTGPYDAPGPPASAAGDPSQDPAELGDDADAESFGIERADRLADPAGEPVVAGRLQGGPGWPGGGERPGRQVQVWPLVDDLRRSPVNELQARVGEHLLGHAGRAPSAADGLAELHQVAVRIAQEAADLRAPVMRLGEEDGAPRL